MSSAVPERMDGWLLQQHGNEGETRAHWHTDPGGGRWVGFINWWSFRGGPWQPRIPEHISQIALAKLVELLIVRGAGT